MTKSMLCAIVVGLSILGCDNTTNRTASNDRATLPSSQTPATPSTSTTSPSSTSAPTTGSQMTAADQALAERVTSSLREDPALAGTVPNMTVHAKNGAVTLHGSVNSAQQRSNIESKVRSMAGVTQVINNLEVASASR